MTTQSETLNTAAELTLVVAVLLVLGALIGGIAVAFNGTVLVGVVLAAAGFVIAVVMGLLAQWAKLVAQS